MIRTRRLFVVALVVTLAPAIAPTAALGAQATFFGLDASNQNLTNANAARDSFVATLESFAVETMEGIAGQADPLLFAGTPFQAASDFNQVVSFAPLAVSPLNVLLDQGPADAAGPGVNDWLLFAQPVTAFGSYFAQGGDGGANTVSLRLENTLRGTSKDVPINVLGPNAPFFNVFFFGVTDTDPFDRVTFIESLDFDGILLDNIVAGQLPPEPHTFIAPFGAFDAPQNWSPSGIPAPNWLASIPNSGPAVKTVDFNANSTVNRLLLESAGAVARLNLNAGTLTVTDKVLLHAGGAIAVQGGSLATPRLELNGGTLQLTSLNSQLPRSIVSQGGRIVVAPSPQTFSLPSIVEFAAGATRFELAGSIRLAAGWKADPAATLEIAQGELQLPPPTTGRYPNLAIAPAARLLVQNLDLDRLTLQGEGSLVMVQPQGDLPGLVQVRQALSLANGARLDLNDNDLILYYSGDSPFSQIQNYILYGLANDPEAPQIASTHARQLVAVGDFPVTLHVPFDNALIGATEWAGSPLAGSNQIIAKYTYFGDLNLDGVVDAQDYLVIDNHFGQSTSAGPFGGDANLDGAVNAQDYLVVDNAFNHGAPGAPYPYPLSASPITAVPEPFSFVLAAMALATGSAVAVRRYRHPATAQLPPACSPPLKLVS